MITKRIIPCLDVKDGRVVKGVNFQKLGDVASPVELAKYYSDNGADELVFYDITASAEGRALFTDILTETARTVFIPLTVGGGIIEHQLVRSVVAVILRQLHRRSHVPQVHEIDALDHPPVLHVQAGNNPFRNHLATSKAFLRSISPV